MDKKLRLVCILGGIVLYPSFVYYLVSIGLDFESSMKMLVLSWAFLWTLGMVSAIVNIGIKTNLFSDIKSDFTTPVYTLTKNGWGDDCVAEVIVRYSCWDNGWFMFFPLIIFFKFKQHHTKYTFEITKEEYEVIMCESLTPKQLFEHKYQLANEEHEKYLAKKKQTEDKIKEINKEYYNNYK